MLLNYSQGVNPTLDNTISNLSRDAHGLLLFPLVHLLRAVGLSSCQHSTASIVGRSNVGVFIDK